MRFFHRRECVYVCERESVCMYACVYVRQVCVCVLGPRIFFWDFLSFVYLKQTYIYKKRIQRVCSVRKIKWDFPFSCLSFFPLFISKHTHIYIRNQRAERAQCGELNEGFLFLPFAPFFKVWNKHTYMLSQRACSVQWMKWGFSFFFFVHVFILKPTYTFLCVHAFRRLVEFVIFRWLIELVMLSRWLSLWIADFSMSCDI